MDEAELVERLQRIQSLYTGATTPGERAAAAKAMERVSTRLEQQRHVEETEYTSSLGNAFQRRLFLALTRKHGLRVYRRKRQSHVIAEAVHGDASEATVASELEGPT